MFKFKLALRLAIYYDHDSASTQGGPAAQDGGEREREKRAGEGEGRGEAGEENECVFTALCSFG